ncbi:MAG: helix-turn-helix transcriptional regulator [Candidatus Humimicrobiaceae bacterium]
MNKLKEKIIEKGIKQGWLAEQIGISETTFSKYVNGSRKIKYETALKIAKLLDCNPDDIFLN